MGVGGWRMHAKKQSASRLKNKGDKEGDKQARLATGTGPLSGGQGGPTRDLQAVTDSSAVKEGRSSVRPGVGEGSGERLVARTVPTFRSRSASHRRSSSFGSQSDGSCSHGSRQQHDEDEDEGNVRLPSQSRSRASSSRSGRSSRAGSEGSHGSVGGGGYDGGGGGGGGGRSGIGIGVEALGVRKAGRLRRRGRRDRSGRRESGDGRRSGESSRSQSAGRSRGGGGACGDAISLAELLEASERMMQGTRGIFPHAAADADHFESSPASTPRQLS